MDFVKNQLTRIQQQLAGLNATQKMLAGALVAIMVMTLFWWSSFAGKAEMQTLLEQTMSSDDIANVTRYLDSRAISYQVVGDRVQVPSDRRYEILAGLEYSQLLPRDTKSAFDEVAKSSNPFISSQQQQDQWNNAKQTELARVMRQFPNVRDAKVFLDTTKQRSFSQSEPSATVYLSLRNAEMRDQRLVNAAADLVSGAVTNLVRQRVRVIIDGVSYPVRGNDAMASAADAGDQVLGMVRQYEQYYRDGLARHLSWIEGVQVDVRVKPKLERIEKVSHTVDPKNKIAEPVSEETNTLENNSTQRGNPEAGVMPNVPMAVGEGGGGDKTSETNEKSKTDYRVDFGITDVKSVHAGGEADITGVSVYVPRSHFARIYPKQTNSSDSNINPTALDAFIQAELVKLRAGVKTCLALTSDELVHVDSFTDAMPMAASMPQAASTSMSLVVSDHVKEIALGALALVSLFMVSNMVRKSAPAPVVAAQQVVKPGPLSGAEEAVGEAGETSPLLDGMELDEDAVKSQQMLTQVQELVQENPDAAASMVKRWLNRA